MREKMPVYSTVKEIREERKQVYYTKLREMYPNLETLTSDEYKNLRKKFKDINDIKILEELMNKSIVYIINAVAEIYSKYDIDEIVPIEEGLSCVILYYNQALLNFNELPDFFSEYVNSTISYYAFCCIERNYRINCNKVKKTDILSNFDIIRLIDKKEFDTLNNSNLIRESFKQSFKKASSKLNDKEKQILDLYFGLSSGEGKTLEEISKIVDISIGGAGNSVLSSLRKIRSSRKIKYIESFKDFDMGN